MYGKKQLRFSSQHRFDLNGQFDSITHFSFINLETVIYFPSINLQFTCSFSLDKTFRANTCFIIYAKLLHLQYIKSFLKSNCFITLTRTIRSQETSSFLELSVVERTNHPVSERQSCICGRLRHGDVRQINNSTHAVWWKSLVLRLHFATQPACGMAKTCLLLRCSSVQSSETGMKDVIHPFQGGKQLLVISRMKKVSGNMDLHQMQNKWSYLYARERNLWDSNMHHNMSVNCWHIVESSGDKNVYKIKYLISFYQYRLIKFKI